MGTYSTTPFKAPEVLGIMKELLENAYYVGPNPPFQSEKKLLENI